jgi:hypothetical protein
MSDQEFLMWVHERLVLVHKESELLDYMHKLRAIIYAMPVGQDSPNDGRGGSDIDDLRKRLHQMEMKAIS